MLKLLFLEIKLWWIDKRLRYLSHQNKKWKNIKKIRILMKKYNDIFDDIIRIDYNK